MRIQKREPPLQRGGKSKSTLAYCIVIFVLTLIVLYRGKLHWDEEHATEPLPDVDFQVHVIDVGQGDSILVSADGQQMLIDAAEPENAKEVTDYLAHYQITALDYMVATHLHADHIGGIPKVLEAVKVSHVVEPICPESILPDSNTYENYLDAVDASGASYEVMQAGDQFTLGGATIDVLSPLSESAKDLNNTSLVLRISYDDVVCLFTGDMEEDEEKPLLAEDYDLKADFLKVGHHGSNTSSGEAFLEQVQPSFAAISCGLHNSYGHPAKVTLDKLAKYTDNVLITANDGDLVFLYDADTGEMSFTAAGKAS